MAGFLLPLIMHILFGVEDMPVELGGTSVIIPRNFVGAGYICAMFIVSCHAISMFTGSCSIVDQIWSISPVVYVWYFCHIADYHPRLIVLALLISVWGTRLTYNFYRKGGYNGEEDYRWPVLRKIIKNPIAWTAFHIGFISVYQNILLLIVVFPAAQAAKGTPIALLPYDLPVTACFILFVLGETIADQQQWNFHKAKKEAKERGGTLTGDVKRGFLTSGLWKYSRHPNFFCEQMVWWTVYAYGCSSSGEWVHWTMVGPVLYTLLFQGSTPFTEWISGPKYPEYKIYQQTTSMLIPLPPRAWPTEAKGGAKKKD